MFAKEGVKFWLIACEKKSDRFACAPAIYISSTYRGACTEIFQNLVSAKPFVDIFLAVFGCPIVCEICLSRPEAGADGGGIACSFARSVSMLAGSEVGVKSDVMA